jgi:hypothetical protein
MLKHLQDLLKNYIDTNKDRIELLKKRASFEIEMFIENIIKNDIDILINNTFRKIKCSDALNENCKKGINYILVRAETNIPLNMSRNQDDDYVDIENGFLFLKNNDSFAKITGGPKLIEELKKKIDPSYIITFEKINYESFLKIEVPFLYNVPVSLPSSTIMPPLTNTISTFGTTNITPTFSSPTYTFPK